MNSIFYGDIMEHLALREKVLAPESFAFNRRVLLSFDNHLVECEKTDRCITEEDVISWVRPQYDHLSRWAVANNVGFLRVFLKYLQLISSTLSYSSGQLCPVFVFRCGAGKDLCSR